MTADEIDQGMLRLFRAQRGIQLLVQVHDSVLIQYPEEREAEIVPWALNEMRIHIPLEEGRDFVVPVEAKCGWNWGDASGDNEDGLVKWKSVGDSRRRSETTHHHQSLSDQLRCSAAS